MRTDASESDQGGAASVGRCVSLFLSLEWWGKGEKGMQDKGNASGHCPSDCLHILFYGGIAFGDGGGSLRSGGIPWVSGPPLEAWDFVGVRR